MRVVLDTNVYISAILFGGVAEKVLEWLSQNESFIRVLGLKFGWDERQITLVLGHLRDRTVLIRPRVRVDVITEKMADNRILACAVAAEADFLISGDRKHLLSLKTFKGIKIVSPREFLDFYS